MRSTPPSTGSSPTPTPLAEIASGTGEYAGHTYTWSQTSDGVTATFSPFLPRNDDIVVGAMKHLVNTVYHVDLADAVASLEGRFIVLGSGTQRYRFLLVKEDTGEVHSIVASEG